MNTSRRKFLKSTGALSASGMVGSLATLGVESANAQASGYKALVAVFMFGGNDANNLIVPVTNYAQYAAVRTVASGIALTQAQVLPFTAAKQAGAQFGFHPAFAPLAPLYASGKLAVLANAGPLVAPLTKAQYQAGVNRPPNLFSHSDQQFAWQGQIPGVPLRTGWGGRYADKLQVTNAGAAIPTITTLAGAQVFNSGLNTTGFVIPSNGGVSVSGQAATGAGLARYTALQAMLSTSTGNMVVDSAAAVMAQSLTANATANPILTATLPPVIQTAFTVAGTLLNTSIAQQLRQVARLIEARATTGVKREIFLVSIGGFDHHSTLLTGQQGLFAQLAPALKSFYDYTVAAGVSTNVTTFTMSDFSRTFIGNASQGTDHAWGAHHLVFGDAVNGGDMYGTFPQLVVRGPDDSGSNGAWIPTTSVDQVGATLSTWFGASTSDLAYIFPNLSRFPTQNLGFV